MHVLENMSLRIEPGLNVNIDQLVKYTESELKRIQSVRNWIFLIINIAIILHSSLLIFTFFSRISIKYAIVDSLYC